MCLNALEFDKALLKNASRDTKRLAEAYGRAFACAEDKFKTRDITIKLRRYEEVPVTMWLTNRCFTFSVWEKNSYNYLGHIEIAL